MLYYRESIYFTTDTNRSTLATFNDKSGHRTPHPPRFHYEVSHPNLDLASLAFSYLIHPAHLRILYDLTEGF